MDVRGCEVHSARHVYRHSAPKVLLMRHTLGSTRTVLVHPLRISLVKACPNSTSALSRPIELGPHMVLAEATRTRRAVSCTHPQVRRKPTTRGGIGGGDGGRVACHDTPSGNRLPPLVPRTRPFAPKKTTQTGLQPKHATRHRLVTAHRHVHCACLHSHPCGSFLHRIQSPPKDGPEKQPFLMEGIRTPLSA